MRWILSIQICTQYRKQTLSKEQLEHVNIKQMNTFPYVEHDKHNLLHKGRQVKKINYIID